MLAQFSKHSMVRRRREVISPRNSPGSRNGSLCASSAEVASRSVRHADLIPNKTVGRLLVQASP